MKKNQQGFVSIVVTMIIIVLVTLITLGFAFLASQNQRQSLNRQLSTQAFYAAESGVNDAIANLTTLGDVTSCNTVIGAALDTAKDVKYTCVLINQSPNSLVYDSISDQSSTIVHIRTSEPVTGLKLSWQDTGSGQQFAAAGAKFYLPQAKAVAGNATSSVINAQTAAFPNHTGMLRATIIPTSATTSTNTLLDRSQTIFLYPDAFADPNNAGSAAFRSTSGDLSREGVFGSGRCNTGNSPSATPLNPRFCNTTITGIGSSDFYIRLRAVYKPVGVSISITGASGSLAISGAQAVIDSTGKANDVLRRIQVRVPLTPSYYFPEFAIESANTICKRFGVYPGGAAVISPTASEDSDPNYSGGAHIYDPGNPINGGETNNKTKDETACQLPGQAKPNF